MANRILTAEVILTLTSEQAEVVLFALGVAELNTYTCEESENVVGVARLVLEQCVKQGVSL